MDAKAKVVAHVVFGKPEDYPPVAIQEYAGSISVIRDRVMANAHREGFHGDFVTRMADLGWWLEPLVTLTDHEAALAEVQADRDCWEQQAADRLKDWDDMRTKYETLLTGLEALAGEWLKEPLGQYEYDQGHAEGMHDCGNELRYRLAELRTLSSAGLEGKKGD